MELSEELRQLHMLREEGVLTDAEFTQAKARLLENPLPVQTATPQFMVVRKSRGEAKKRWLKQRFSIAMVGYGIVAAFFLFLVIRALWASLNSQN